MRFKVRPANINEELRARFETYGQTMITIALATAPNYNFAGPLFGLIQQQHEAAVDWIRECNERHEVKETRLEIVEWAILVFVIVGVIVESGLGKWIVTLFFHG